MFSTNLDSSIPRLDGSNPNDWVSSPILIHKNPHPRDFREHGMVVHLRIAVESGTGSNTWLCEPVIVRNPRDHWRTWELWTPPHIGAVNVCPIVFTEADLPYSKMFNVPARLGHLAIRFARSDVGENVLKMKTYTQRN